MIVGLVGWRGMVGSVLMQRMQEEGDFDHFEPIFFSTSNAGGKAPAMAKNSRRRMQNLPYQCFAGSMRRGVAAVKSLLECRLPRLAPGSPPGRRV